MTKFFLYGHYDSRGGATLIEDESKEKADIRYAEAFCNEDSEWGTKAEQDKQLIEEDFLGKVTFTSYRDVQDGEDLEQGEPIPSERADAEKANAFEDGLAWADDKIVETTPNPFRELLWERRDDSDTLVELRLCPKGHSPAYEDQREMPTPHSFSSKEPVKQAGWKRSSLGEDACGVILMKKPTSPT